MEYQQTGRTLGLNHGNAMPQNIIALDTETRPVTLPGSSLIQSHEFRLGVAINGKYRRNKVGSRSSFRLSDRADFWELLESQSVRKRTVWVVCHNTLFDFVTIGGSAEIASGRYTLDAPRAKRHESNESGSDQRQATLCCLESPPFILGLRCEATGGRVVFVDTLNWFRCTLDELGQSIGKVKLPMPAFGECDETWFQYCERDAEIVFDAFVQLMEWKRANNLGVFRYTGPAQAMAAYRHRFMPCKIMFHDNAPVKALEREGFIGGRTECFRVGEIEGDVYQLDVNSLYPSVMRDGLFPRRLNVFDMDTSPKTLPDVGGWHRCVAEVDLNTDKAIYPFRQDGLTIYPLGKFRTVLCGVELESAVAAGHVETVGRLAKYNTFQLFTEYVDEMWAMRQRYKQEHNEAYANFSKMLLNSLFGKFAQRPIKWIECPEKIDGLDWLQWCELDWTTKRSVMYRSVGGTVFRQNQETERADTLPAISAFVAAAGRVKMNQYREIAECNNVYYQGVDGLLVSRAGYYRLLDYGGICGTGLGQLRLVCQTNSTTIYNAADYRIGSKHVIAGRSRNADASNNEAILQRRFSGPAELFSGRPQESVMERIVEWKRKGEYRKGTIGPGGWVAPFLMNA